MDRRDFLKTIPALALVPWLGKALAQKKPVTTSFEFTPDAPAITGRPGVIIDRTIDPPLYLISGDQLQLHYEVEDADKARVSEVLVALFDRSGELVKRERVSHTIEGDTITFSPIRFTEAACCAAVRLTFFD